MSFKCATPVISRNDLKSGDPGVVAHARRPKAKTHTKKCRGERFAIPSDEESDTDVFELVYSPEDESGQSSAGDESIDRMSRAARRFFCGEELIAYITCLFTSPRIPIVRPVAERK